MAHYHVRVEHTPDECLRTLDDIVGFNPELLDRFWFTCSEEDHEGTAILEAPSRVGALDQLPPSLRSEAGIMPVRQHTMHSIKALHRMVA